jgi:hypothetical protein
MRSLRPELGSDELDGFLRSMGNVQPNQARVEAAMDDTQRALLEAIRWQYDGGLAD